MEEWKQEKRMERWREDQNNEILLAPDFKRCYALLVAV